MKTCESPRRVLLAANELAQLFLPNYSSKFRRKDFTLRQLRCSNPAPAWTDKKLSYATTGPIRRQASSMRSDASGCVADENRE
jgi:hypothetical protein